MTEPKFTPGLWRVEFSMCEDMTFAVIVNENRKCIAEVFLNDNEDEQEANAHLIAAAPQVYAALQAVCSLVEIHICTKECYKCIIGEALRKARGESEAEE